MTNAYIQLTATYPVSQCFSPYSHPDNSVVCFFFDLAVQLHTLP
jgi:hypothetical protein